jgi:CBS domain-containing protein
VRQALSGEPVSRFMNPHPVVVPASLDLRSWVEDYVYDLHRKAFPVVAADRLVGLITTAALSKYPRAEWGRHTVGEAMRRDLATVSIGPENDALRALERMQRTGLSRLLVIDEDRLRGIVSLKDLLRFLDLKLDLERGDVRLEDEGWPNVEGGDGRGRREGQPSNGAPTRQPVGHP